MGGTSIPAGYEFGAHYITEKIQMMGKMGMSGNMNANYVHIFTPNLIAKLTGQLSRDEGRSQGAAEIEYDGEDFSSKFGITSAGGITGSILQSITSNVAVGLQLFSQQGNIGGVLISRYNNKDFVAVASATSFGIVSGSYVQKVSEKVFYIFYLYIIMNNK